MLRLSHGELFSRENLPTVRWEIRIAGEEVLSSRRSGNFILLAFVNYTTCIQNLVLYPQTKGVKRGYLKFIYH